MRILHTSDWHLGKRLDLFSRIAEQRQVMDEICQLADEHEVDAVLVAGDLFDAFNPSTEAQELLYLSLKRLSKNGTRPVIAIAGNHDSADAIQAPDPLARLHGIILLGYIATGLSETVTDGGLKISFPAPGGVRFEQEGCPALNVLASPYANERRFQQELKELENLNEMAGGAAEGGTAAAAEPLSEAEFIEKLARLWKSTADALFRSGDVNVFIGHLFTINTAVREASVEDLQEPEDEKPILYKGGLPPIPVAALPNSVQYAALGHLHRSHFISETPLPTAYCGSPLAYSRSESDQQKFVHIVDVEPGEAAEVTRVALTAGRPILRPDCTSVVEALEWLAGHQDAYVELTLKLDNYLSSEDRRRIYTAHQRILSIVPEISGAEDFEGRQPADISKSIEKLFKEYYASEHQGIPPAQELTDLFREVLSRTGDPE